MLLLKFLAIFLVGGVISMPADEIRDVVKEGGECYMFVPFGIDTLGVWGPDKISLHPIDVSGEPRAGAYFGDRFSLTIQQSNVAILLDTLASDELSMDNEAFSKLMFIIPGSPDFSRHMLDKEKHIIISDFIDENNEALKMLMEYIDKGFTKKGLTFNIYDDNIRGAAIALFRLYQELDEKTTFKFTQWAKQEINNDMLEYAMRLASLYSVKLNHEELPPPFITKPNYFVNGETITKATNVQLNNGVFHRDEARINQYYRTDDIIYFNTNYSGWYSYEEPCEGELNYFREDVGLNSYYYGVHLLHPFWMSNDELDEINPRHAEHYYYTHQQLMARYLLEKEHLRDKNCSKVCENMYNPYLMYDNGLLFPTRTSSKWEWSEGRAFLTSIDIAMKEFISRGLIVMDNGTIINMTTENHAAILAKLIRANLDGIKAAKIVRSLYGYGGKVPSVDEYNPAPSVLHHPETSLRDPVYWDLVKCLLKYFIDYKNLMVPFDLSDFETNDFKIVNANIPNITTYFSYYEFDISKAIRNYKYDAIKSPLVLAARQRRLQHIPFRFDFDVESKKEEDVIVRLFLGPKCELECWDSFDKFYEMDSFMYKLVEGTNSVFWLPQNSERLSDEYVFNLGNVIEYDNEFSIFKFPKSLLMPHGLEEGLNLSLFVMMSPINKDSQADIVPESNYYQRVPPEFDNKPLGFPFHRQAVRFNFEANNYKFYNITIFHKKSQIDKTGYFSANLY